MILLKLVHSVISFFATNLLWSEGWVLVLVSSFLSFVGFFFWRPLLYVAVIFICFCLFFFRNPERECPQALYDDRVLICPADGKVVQVKYDPQGKFDGYHQVVSIFLSPFDVHVNWLPVSGVVQKIAYHKGQFVPAFLSKSSHLNERNDVHLRTQNGKTLIVRQIAGTIARTIRWWIEPHQHIRAGQKYGMIKFGSRVDILLPHDVEISVAVGDRVYGGRTIVGRWLP